MFDKLCAPAQIYLVVSVVMLILSYFGLSAISQQLSIHRSSSPVLQTLNFTYQKDSRTSYIVPPLILMFLAFFVYIIETIKGLFFNTAGTISNALNLP